MKKRRFVFLLLLCLLLLAACGNSSGQGEPAVSGEAAQPAEETPLPEDAAPAEEETPAPDPGDAEQSAPADGYSDLGGMWKVGAVYYNNRLISVHDYPELEDLYDTVYLSFNEDGTFLYINVFFSEGTYTRLGDGDSFLLKTDRVYRHEFQGGEYVEVEMESAPKTTHIITFTPGDAPSLRYSEYDPISGKAKANADPLVFEKS